MAEFLAPGIYIEETSFRSKSIEGVSTSTAGFVGQCRYGPVNGPPTLVTSFDEFQLYFGNTENLILGSHTVENYFAYGVKLFFDNGGQNVYISRIFRSSTNTITEQDVDADRATGKEMLSSTVRFKARFPGLIGNRFVLAISGTRSGNILSDNQIHDLQPGDVVEITAGSQPVKTIPVEESGPNALDANNVYVARISSADPTGIELVRENNSVAEVLDDYATVNTVQKISLTITLKSWEDSEDQYQGLSTDPSSDVYIGQVLQQLDTNIGMESPTDRSRKIFIEEDNPPTSDLDKFAFARDLLNELLLADNREQSFNGGNDGLIAVPDDYLGQGENYTASGLVGLAEIDDIAIVAAPGHSGLLDENHRQTIREHLISHCEKQKYRFAILSAERDADFTTIQVIRAQHESSFSALYYPWLVIANPHNSDGQGPDKIIVPPEGAVAGIYARTDIERGVHKAPADKVIRNILQLSRDVSKSEQQVLNPSGINCLRFFEGKGNRVWGARTMNSDPEWKYINVRRLLIFLEHSIVRGTQWAVFEPNNERLWLNIRSTIESLLTETWLSGALMGAKSEEAFFVRCDRTTMTQNDLDNGRSVYTIGVAPIKPGEFIILRMGQWSADASII